jgi:FAD:protein FMN transferase
MAASALSARPLDAALPGDGALPFASWEALGSTVVLRLTDPSRLPAARALVERELAAIDLACSRFRADSDLSRVNAAGGGRPVRVSPLLVEALELALRAAALTDGDVDPTIGASLVLAGYDRDIRLLQSADSSLSAGGGAEPEGTGEESADGPPADQSPRSRTHTPSAAPSAFFARRDPPAAPPVLRARLLSGPAAVSLDPVRSTVRVPRGIVLDLGATAKAWAADRAALAVFEAFGCGALVGLGGDISCVGPPPSGGWRIHVTDDHRSSASAPGQTVVIASGGLATSSTAVRRIRRGGATMHHIVDPSSGAPVRGPWRTASVAAASCADANIASTAALVRGERAPAWLSGLGVPSRLVARDGAVLRIGDWPDDPPPAVAGHGGPAPARLLAPLPRADDHA